MLYYNLIMDIHLLKAIKLFIFQKLLMSEKKQSGDIKVADVTLAQLSRGFYTSNATVFKELINNAYDASATEVRINTNFPEFNFIFIIDNGIGMTLESFTRHFAETGIGSSTKRRDRETKSKKYNRPLIGRLGIGMMAIGQICYSFQIESHYVDEDGNEAAFKAEIILDDVDIPSIDDEISKDINYGNEMNVGKWSYEKIEFNEEKKGFRIFSDDVRRTFRKEMKNAYDEERDYRKVPLSLKGIKKIIYQNKSVKSCGPYIETIWELCSLCPLPYNDDDFSPINFHNNKKIDIKSVDVLDVIAKKQKELRKQKFNVYFDGLGLKRLIKLPEATIENSILFYLNFDKSVFKSKLKFSGYVLAQVSKAVRPYELNGIQVRIKNVGIGKYDNTFLNYSKQIETIRSKWVSGEVFVEKGLENALNIDRDSFNEHEEHFRAIQNYLHDRFDEIFKILNKTAKENREENKLKQVNDISKKLQDYVFESSDGNFKLKEVDDPNMEDVVYLDKEKKLIIINNSRKIFKAAKSDHLYKIVDIAYLIAENIKKNEHERQQYFKDILKKAISELV